MHFLKNIYTLLVFLFLTVYVFAQGTNKRQTSTSMELLSMYIPEGYEIYDKEMGDLNLDAYKDYILILEKNWSDDQSNKENTPDWLFIILTGNKDGRFSIAETVTHLVEDMDDSGCPPCAHVRKALQIRKGVFVFTKSTGGSSVALWKQYAFRYSTKDNTWHITWIAIQESNTEFNEDDRPIAVKKEKKRFITSSTLKNKSLRDFNDDDY